MNRSYCPKCGKMISWHDNVPVLSFLLLRGHCRHCKGSISWQYPIVEISTALLFGAAAYSLIDKFGGNWPYLVFLDNYFTLLLARNLFIIFVFTVVFIYDFRWFLVSDRFVLPAAAVLLTMNLMLGSDWRWAVASSFLGALFFFIQFAVSRGKWVGGGDIRLGLLVGAAFCSLDYLLVVLMIAYFVGSLVGITLMSFKKKGWKSELPFGVFLAISSVFCLFFGRTIIDWYLGMI